VALQAAGWAALASQLARVSQALEERDDSFFLDLGGSKRASISCFKGGCVLLGGWVGERGWVGQWAGGGCQCAVNSDCVVTSDRAVAPPACLLQWCLATALRQTNCTAVVHCAGRYSVDLREFYEKEGKMLVGGCERQRQWRAAGDML
jgi:hypothetical protein